MGKRLMGTLTAFLVLIVLLPASALAQGTTGTIRGKVTDQATGEPLAAVNVTVLEVDGTITQMGAFTNADGDYVIVNVPPSRYNLRATMMGYKTFEVQEMLVTVGVSTTRDFQLEATVLDVGEVVTIIAEREIIQRDVTATQQSYTIEEMERMAVSNTTDILTLQTNTYQMSNANDMISGYRDRGLEQVHMRGGRNAEVAFMIDGMQVTNLVFGGQAARVNPFSLSEMVVMAGGMSAEFGNAMSGVVNMITREGGSTYTANFEFLSSEFSGAEQDDLRDMTRATGYLGGPVPMVPRLTFFVSASAESKRDGVLKKDDIIFDTTPSTPTPDFTYGDTDPYLQYGPDGRRVTPLDIHSGWMGSGYDDLWDGMLSTTYKLNPSMKLNVSGQLNGRWAMPYTNAWRWSMVLGYPQDLQDHLIWGTLEEGGTDLETENISGSGGLWTPNEKNVLFENNYRFAGVWTHQLNQSTFYTVRTSYYDYNRTMRVFRWTNEDGYLPNRDNLYDGYWSEDDAMTQHQLRYIPHGYWNNDFEFNRKYGYVPWYSVSGLGNQGSDRYWSNHYDITRTLKSDITSQVTTHHQVKAGLLYNKLMLNQYDVQILWYDPPYFVDYVQRPWELSMYVQDKIEYDFLILNVGFRYDSANAGQVPYWTDPRDPIDPDTGDLIIDPFDPEVAPVASGELRSQISPRLGISHPVTDAAVVYFNYGHFYQNPVYRNLYIQGTLEDAVPLLGNPNMTNEKTVSYEIGYKHQFTDIYALETTIWARDTSNMVGSELIPAFYGGTPNPYDYTVFVNYDYASSKGVDLSLIRRYADFFSARVNYSFMTTQSNRDDPWQGYRDDDTLENAPKRPRVLGWDQPHRMSANVSISLPDGFGPEMAGMHPFQSLNASLIYRADAGRPYTPRTRTKALEPNSGRRPWTFQTDLRLYKDFRSFGLRYSVFADIRNLFDRKNVSVVFARTGKSDDPGPDATSYSDNYDRFDYYGTPRTINIGIRFFF